MIESEREKRERRERERERERERVREKERERERSVGLKPEDVAFQNYLIHFFKPMAGYASAVLKKMKYSLKLQQFSFYTLLGDIENGLYNYR